MSQSLQNTQLIRKKVRTIFFKVPSRPFTSPIIPILQCLAPNLFLIHNFLDFPYRRRHSFRFLNDVSLAENIYFAINTTVTYRVDNKITSNANNDIKSALSSKNRSCLSTLIFNSGNNISFTAQPGVSVVISLVDSIVCAM